MVIFALLVPLILAVCGVVIGLGNWFVHGKHLQTKADAGAIAGGGAFQFPCFAGVDAIDTAIADVARQYAGPVTAPPAASPNPSFNPQVGQVWGRQRPRRSERPTVVRQRQQHGTRPRDLDFCDGTSPMRVEVKLTEDNSFPLASLIPLFPDIKRKAAVELFETDGMSGVLPIAVRAPEPQSALAIFYDENDPNKRILDREYFLEKTGPGGTGWVPGSTPPSGLHGWSTEVGIGDARGWSSVDATAEVGVVVAISYRGACGTWGGSAPASPPPGLYTEPTGRCLEDGLGQGLPGYTSVDQICNQGGNVQVANCFYTTEPNNSSAANDDTVQSGLHFIRGFSTPAAGQGGDPQLHSAYLTSSACSTGYGSAYFAAFPNVCPAGMSATIDAGSCHRLLVSGNPTGPCIASNPPNTVETRTAANVEVKYTLVHGTGNPDDICDFGPACDLNRSGTGMISATGPLVMSGPIRTRYAVGLRVRFQNTFVQGLPDCSRTNFGGNCEFYFTSSGVPIGTTSRTMRRYSTTRYSASSAGTASRQARSAGSI